MTDQERVDGIVRERMSDSDILFLLRQIDVRSTVLGNLMAEYARMENPQPPLEAYSTSHAAALATLSIGAAAEYPA